MVITNVRLHWINTEIKTLESNLIKARKDKKKSSHIKNKLILLKSQRDNLISHNKNNTSNIQSDTESNNEKMALTEDKVLELTDKLLKFDFDGEPAMLTKFTKRLKALELAVPHADNQTYLISLITLRLSGRAEEVVPETPTSVTEIISALETNSKGKTVAQVKATLSNLTYSNKNRIS